MKADLARLVDDLASRADDLLSDARNRTEARTRLRELVESDYPALSDTERAGVVGGVMRILEQEDFFGIEFVGDPFSEHDSEDD